MGWEMVGDILRNQGVALRWVSAWAFGPHVVRRATERKIAAWELLARWADG